MKRGIVTALLAAGLAAAPAVAQQYQHQHGTIAPANAKRGQGGMMQDSEAMQAHQQKMEEMRALMQRAHATTDPAERRRLMGEHRQMMQAQMASMMKGDNASMMHACQERMAMMHDMMAQMAAEQEMKWAK
jgi:protein CpxP